MVEIPKSLVLADVAIRLLYRNYDTMSPRCSTFSPKIKKIKEPQPAEKVEKVEEEKKEKVDTPVISFKAAFNSLGYQDRYLAFECFKFTGI